MSFAATVLVLVVTSCVWVIPETPANSAINILTAKLETMRR
jgi:hypothetical protein